MRHVPSLKSPIFPSKKSWCIHMTLHAGNPTAVKRHNGACLLINQSVSYSILHAPDILLVPFCASSDHEHANIAPTIDAPESN